MTKKQENTDQSIKIFDLHIFSKSRESLLSLLRNHLEESSRLMTVMTPNPEQIVLSRKDPVFMDHLQSADLLLPDGTGLVIASKLIDLSREKPTLTERITGREVTLFLLNLAGEKGLRVLVLGGREYGDTKNAGSTLLNLPQPYERAFWLEAYADVEAPTKEEEASVVAAIKKVKPTIVLVAFGAPWQEQWVVEHKELLSSSGVQVAMVIGGALDVILGKVPQAPSWMQNLGLEWLFRLLQEPWRWRRQLKLLEFIKLTYQSM